MLVYSSNRNKKFWDYFAAKQQGYNNHRAAASRMWYITVASLCIVEKIIMHIMGSIYISNLRTIKIVED